MNCLNWSTSQSAFETNLYQCAFTAINKRLLIFQKLDKMFKTITKAAILSCTLNDNLIRPTIQFELFKFNYFINNVNILLSHIHVRNDNNPLWRILYDSPY